MYFRAMVDELSNCPNATHGTMAEIGRLHLSVPNRNKIQHRQLCMRTILGMWCNMVSGKSMFICNSGSGWPWWRAVCLQWIMVIFRQWPSTSDGGNSFVMGNNPLAGNIGFNFCTLFNIYVHFTDQNLKLYITETEMSRWWIFCHWLYRNSEVAKWKIIIEEMHLTVGLFVQASICQDIFLPLVTSSWHFDTYVGWYSHFDWWFFGAYIWLCLCPSHPV